MLKFLIVSCLSAVALATPEADADADAGYLGYGLGHAYAYAPAVHNSYPNYPGYSAPGFSRTIHGLHKRSADAHYGYGYAYAPAVYNSYPNWPGVSAPGFSSTLYGVRGKRSADAHLGYANYGIHAFAPYAFPAAAVSTDGSSYTVNQGHPGFAGSYQSVTRSKRSADAHYGYGFAPYAVSGYGIHQAHPSGSSFQHVSRGYGYGYGK